MTALTARERHRAAVFARDPHVCALRPEATGFPGEDSRAGLCGEKETPDARLEADHILKVTALLRHRDRLKLWRDPLSDRQAHFLTVDPGVWIADPRNGWILCRRHHGLKDRKLIVITEEVLLPEHLAVFVGEYDLLGVYEAELHPRIVPASQNGSRRSGASRRGI